MASQADNGTTALHLALAWGVVQTVLNALKLFQ